MLLLIYIPQALEEMFERITKDFQIQTQSFMMGIFIDLLFSCLYLHILSVDFSGPRSKAIVGSL